MMVRNNAVVATYKAVAETEDKFPVTGGTRDGGLPDDGPRSAMDVKQSDQMAAWMENENEK